MASEDLVPRGREYSRWYFPAIFRSLQAEKRIVIPQHTEQDVHDPLNAMQVFQGSEGHRWSTQMDLLAVNLYWEGATRRSSMVALARLVGERLLRPFPASADVLGEIIGTPGPADAIFSTGVKFLTDADAENPSITFEHTGDPVLAGNAEFTLIVEDAGVLSSPIVETLPAGDVWVGPVVNDAVYIGHATRMSEQAKISFSASGSGITLVHEYRDGSHRQMVATNVTDNGSTLTFGLDADTAFATPVPHIGITLLVTHVSSGRSELLTVSASGSDNNNVTSASLFGQSGPSTNPNDYVITSEWLPLPITVIDTSATHTTIAWDIPQDLTSRWSAGSVGGNAGFWMRQRVSVIGAAVSPADYVVTPEATRWFGMQSCVQGETITDEEMGVTNGAAFQNLALGRPDDFIEDSGPALTFAADASWELVDNLLESGPSDKHYELLELSNGSLVTQTGDGINGRVPPPAATVTGTYRVLAGDDGNVGEGTITNGGSGSEFLSGIVNPRPATGWRQIEADETDDLSIARARRNVPARIRARNQIVVPDDVETIIIRDFRTADVRSPFSRAIIYEFGFGWKTSKLVMVGGGGEVPTQSDLDELSLWINGRTVGVQRFGGTAPLQTRQNPVAFALLGLNLDITVEVLERFEGSAEDDTRAALISALDPLAVDRVGDYLWEPGFEVTPDRVKAFVAAAVKGYFSATFASFTGVTLADNELPSIAVPVGSLNISITTV